MSDAVQIRPLPLPTSARPLFRGWKWQVVLLVAAIGWLYAPIMARLVRQWYTDPNYSHGIFVPLFALFLVWESQGRLRELPKAPSWWGLGILLSGLALLASGVIGAELFLSRVSLLFVLAGMIVLFLGWDYLRVLRFPLAILLLMIPIPEIVLNQITLPLQRLASILATQMLAFLGVPVLREGNILHLPALDLGIAEACSGIRSLMSLGTLSIIYGYFMDPRTWARILLALASIPIAVFANGLRIVGAGLIGQYWDPEKAHGFFHTFSGFVVFAVSGGLLVFVHYVLRRIAPKTSSQN